MPVVCNVADASSIEAMTAEVLDQWGRVDILMNNAAIQPPGGNIDIQPKHGLTDDEVETMLKDAWQNAEVDMNARRVADTRAQLDNVLRAIEKQKEHVVHLTADEQERLQDALEEAAASGDIDNADKLKGVLDEVEEASFPLAEALMNVVAKNAIQDQRVSDLS